MTEFTCLLHEVVPLPVGRYGLRMTVAPDVLPPARCAIVILGSEHDARFPARAGDRGAVLDQATPDCELLVDRPIEVLIAAIGRSDSRREGIEIELIDLGIAEHGAAAPADASSMAMLAHIERRGDVRFRMNDMMGDVTLQRRIEGFSIEWPGCPADMTLSYRVAMANGELSDWHRAGSFVGSRGKGLGITSASFALGGAGAANWDLSVEAIFGGAVDGAAVGSGQHVVLSGRTGREVLTGLRFAMKPAEPVSAPAALPEYGLGVPARPHPESPMVTQRGPEAPLPPAQPAPKPRPAAASAFGRVKMYKSER